MIRLLLLLSAGLFLTLQIGGQDRGQLRFGLMEAEREAMQMAAAPAASVVIDEPATRAADSGPVLPAVNADIVQVVFAPAQPIVSQPMQPTAANTPNSPADVKYVQGRSVNVRSGPSTNNAVVGRLTRGEAVTVVWVEANGWARVRLEGDGVDGFMSMSFLGDTP
ncbi:MAG: SH3 domain-containing protein [Pseudotabrizicola sp.]|uniref:SH3 domain-containing protein n=1 Tax=Pseudotabrizicola sp. TaxID=2939647 RepID=UPI0027223470|nr:SH3 domain-containing protein [Pseudotabrizicola sp.]MDO8881888.1 SH3 domain-containing protein [Pseudotabrizicola sp.]MDP2082359.1 SH3 domain-containing protein [Pseudotabrizicola sp.]MDZ7574314.1 SH3 domain-containing protein [Pseudotabrizicola sp.]